MEVVDRRAVGDGDRVAAGSEVCDGFPGVPESDREPRPDRARERDCGNGKAEHGLTVRCGGRGLARRREGDRQLLDARALDLVDAEAQAVVLDLVAALRRAPELAEDEAADRVVVLLRQLDAELLVEVVDREGAVDADRVGVEPLDGLVRQVELVLDLADDLLEHVLERDDPDHVSVLVEDDRHVLVLLSELRQQRGEVFCLRDHVRGTDQLLEPHLRDAALVHRLDEVAHMQDADHLVERAAVDGVARVRRVEDRLQRLLRRQVDRECDDLGPRHHHLVDLLVGEVEDLVEHLALLLLDLARLLGLGDVHADLLLCVGDDTQRAVRSREWRANAFGTSSPSVTCRYVTATYAKTNARPWESSGSSIHPAMNGSPTTPRRIENAVMPSWTVPMKRIGLSMIRNAIRARRLPS